MIKADIKSGVELKGNRLTLGKEFVTIYYALDPDIGRGIDKEYVIAWAPLPQPYRGFSEERTKA